MHSLTFLKESYFLLSGFPYKARAASASVLFRVLVSILRMVFLYFLVRVRFCCGLGDLDIEPLPFSAPIYFNGGS